ncbi:hypothetical protein [Fructobacillus cardui]|uniref:hypothetical protein n=1 Tax=Fructobacillus cardui TaxID=2893170 RepID=UPI00200B3733|nr:hypothetical protein [Fructobacillus cardui]MCK8626698.1 hypothetical protein [Fructobacillus cardui]CAK1227111.1 unnamed protein product [Fructobacillus cardui]
MQLSKVLYLLFKYQKNVQVFEKRKKYMPGYDIDITHVYAETKRHPKMPDDYVVVIIPK